MEKNKVTAVYGKSHFTSVYRGIFHGIRESQLATKAREIQWRNDGLDFKEGKEEGTHDIEWEMRHWFDRTAPNLKWAESTPDKTWPDLAATFPCLCLLARRFLCIVPTSAPSERVWLGFGHVITDQSSTIDSNIAMQTAFLRYNRDLIPAIPLCRA